MLPWAAMEASYSRVVYIDTELSADVTPQGWNAWGKSEAMPLAYYAEFNSTGPGANPSCARSVVAPAYERRKREKFEPRVFLAGFDHWDAEAEAEKEKLP